MGLVLVHRTELLPKELNYMRKTKFLLLLLLSVILIQTTVFADTYERNEKETTIENVIDGVLLIPADNPYFPNMTITEIKQWYVNEVNKFISTGLSKKNLEEYKKSLYFWAKWTYEGSENRASTKYQALVENFNKEDTQEFYQVQMKMYDFVKDYQKRYNVYLNFENWDEMIETETTPMLNETVISKETSTSSTNSIYDTFFEDKTTQENEISTTKNRTISNQNSSQNNNIIIPIVITVIITLGISIAVFIFIYKKKK